LVLLPFSAGSGLPFWVGSAATITWFLPPAFCVLPPAAAAWEFCQIFCLPELLGGSPACLHLQLHTTAFVFTCRFHTSAGFLHCLPLLTPPFCCVAFYRLPGHRFWVPPFCLCLPALLPFDLYNLPGLPPFTVTCSCHLPAWMLPFCRCHLQVCLPAPAAVLPPACHYTFPAAVLFCLLPAV